MSSVKEMDWKEQYAIAVKKNRDWRDLYALVSGRKGRPSLDFVKKELDSNKARIVEALTYFQSQEVKPSSSRDVFKECGGSWSKERKTDITAPFLMNKLHAMTGMESGLAWEVLSNYLQYAFRGPPDSLQKLLAQNEEKAQAVIADLFCFYYRERMFILKILYHILTNTTGDLYSEVFCSFIKEHVKFDSLYESVSKQLRLVSEAHQPNLSCLSHLAAPRYLAFWLEHNSRERVQLVKLLIVALRQCPREVSTIARLQEVLKLLEESKVAERELPSRSKESPYKTLRRLYTVHFIQLIGFDMLNGEDSRLCDKEVFTSINEKVKLLVDRKAEEGAALLSIWFIVHHLTPLGTQSQAMRELIAHTVRAANPWLYFSTTLTCPDILDDQVISEAVYYALYQVAFLSVVNFGLDYVRCEDFHKLVALLVRDPRVLKHFWLTENDGLQLVLRECERFFPVVWQPVFDIYTSIASHSESYVNQIEKRVEREVKFTQLQTRVINMESLGNNVFRSLEPVQPFVASNKIVIPVGTRCVVSVQSDIYIHWDFSVSIWHVVKETLYRWSQKMVQDPKPPEEEMLLLRSNVLSVLSFYNEMLKNRKEHKKIVFFAVDEMFSRIELYHERKDAEMLNACLKTCTLLLKYYPKDVVMLLEVSRAIPDMDKVVLDHIQCAKGDFYHSNGVKTILELVELNSGKFTVLVSYLEFIYKLFELPSVYESWAALAGVQFVLRDVFPHYNQWIFADERQRIHIEWLCIQIIWCVLDVTLEEINPPETSVMTQVEGKGKQPLTCILPTKNLFANTVLHHLLNWEPAIALIHIVSLGDQQLFSWVESFHSWDAQCCLELISSVHSALSILNKCILFKHTQHVEKTLTRLEREIYKEPKETDTYRVVINVAGYVYNFLSPDVRCNSVKLLSRFADNRHQSLMACIGMEANTMRQMYLKPLYSSTESEEIKVAVLELVTECIHKQASLAEAFLNALELKECVQKKSGEESEGFVHIALAIIRKRKETPNDRAYLASVQLLHALWHERRTLVISYIRMRDNFFTNFCHPLFHIAELKGQVAPAYAYILTCLGTEIYWYKDQVHSALQDSIGNLFKNNQLIRLSLYCTDQLHGVPRDESSEMEDDPTHSAISTKILIAWKEFVYVLMKSFPEKVKELEEEKSMRKKVQEGNKEKNEPEKSGEKETYSMRHILCIHALNALANEIIRQGNMLAISTLAELYLLLVTTQELEKDVDKNLAALKKISSILTQLPHHYKLFSESAMFNILASCCRFFESTEFSAKDVMSSDWAMHMERIIRAVCSLLSRELGTFLVDRGNERTKEILPSLLCLGIILGQEMGEHTQELWRDLVASYHIASQLIETVAAALQMIELPESCLLMLELLSELVCDDWTPRQADVLELHSVWDSLKPPIQDLFGPVPVCLEEKSLFEATNWCSVYMRALNLVTALVTHPSSHTRELGFDFLYQHEKFICDIFEFKDDSLKETALELVSAALRLLWHVIEAIVPWNWKLKTTLGRILVKVKQYVTTVVDLLGDPDSLLKRKVLAQSQKTFPLPELKGKDMHLELQQLQSRLLGMLVESLSVLKETCPLHSDLLSADRLGLPIYSLRLLVEPRPPAETGPEYHTLVNLINLTAKRLASNLRISPRTSGMQLAASKSVAEDKSNDTTKDSTCLQMMGKDDNYFAAKLSTCSQTELKLVLELTVHYMISNTLLTILSDQMGFHQSVIFLRDLSTEAKTFSEYAQRLCYGKESTMQWTLKPVELGNYKQLTWGSADQSEMEDSISLGCALLPEADSDESSTSRRSASPGLSGERFSKKLKVNMTRVPRSLGHFLPTGLEFSQSYEPKKRDRKSIGFDNFSEDEEISSDFILFCNHILKQMFGMHGFDERSLRAAL
uniref:Nucleoporin Nup188 N-terminal subdomain III domain-containing protein n=1 Tax=Graphocephala atropunctata TaxID=36148 RepID=A0A1B6KHK2_9HEMI